MSDTPGAVCRLFHTYQFTYVAKLINVESNCMVDAHRGDITVSSNTPGEARTRAIREAYRLAAEYFDPLLTECIHVTELRPVTKGESK